MRRFLLLALSLVLIVLPVGGSASAQNPAAADDPSGDEPIEEIAEAAERFVTSLPGVATGPLVVPGRESEPVVLTGEHFPTWAALADVTAKAPDPGGAQCQGVGEECSHNSYEDPDASTQEHLDAEGVPVDRLVAYRWDGQGFTQIPFQVDEVFTRYLSNNASGFAFYSLVDAHTTYAFDREGFRWTDSAVDDACRAVPASEVATDPVPGLDTLDELVFMARDAGPQAGADAVLPDGITDAYEVAVVDPYRPDSPGYVYIALADEDGPRPAFDATNGYVRYDRDADADVFLYSQSSYSNYGNAPHGPWFDPETGVCHTDPDEWRQRRPGDQATVTTPRYRFRYDGRWLMTELAVSADADGDWTYGRDLVDRWKARAFQQRPGGETPCCGYEEEENNWGGSSQLLGELAGPVRVVRETWGADSGTNVVRRETFYRDEIRQKTYLRVHPIPPLDGIYAQWDHNAMAVETYYNPHVPDGVAIDGRNDEVFGNSYVHVSQEGIMVDGNDSVSDLIRDLNDGTPLVIGDPEPGNCSNCVSNDIDTADPLFSGVNALLAWEQIAGPHGTLVTRWSSEDVTPGGAAHTAFALPYYRDDACFDDGTGSDPGPHLNQRRPDDGEYAYWTDEDGNVRERECWDIDRHRTDPEYAADLGTARFFQGSVGTHGLHLLLIADSDNAMTTLPLTEINAEQRIVVLPPTLENVGERYGRGFEKPLAATARPVALGGPQVPGPGDDEGDEAGADEADPDEAGAGEAGDDAPAVGGAPELDPPVSGDDVGRPSLPTPPDLAAAIGETIEPSPVGDAIDHAAAEAAALPDALVREVAAAVPEATGRLRDVPEVLLGETTEPAADRASTVEQPGEVEQPAWKATSSGQSAPAQPPPELDDAAAKSASQSPSGAWATAPERSAVPGVRQLALVGASLAGAAGAAVALAVLLLVALGWLQRRIRSHL